ncbi:hypothetical protein [Mycobacterium sp. NPDC004974]
MHAAVVDSMTEGAAPDRDLVHRLIELDTGRIAIVEYRSEVLKAADRIAGSARCLTASYQTASTTGFQIWKTPRGKTIRPVTSICRIRPDHIDTSL